MNDDRLRMKTILLLAACAAVLAGCAGTETVVRANSTHDFGTGVRTYALATGAATVTDEESSRYASAIERRLAGYGFSPEPATAARYRLMLSHETRLASVDVGYPRCADDLPCGAPVLPSGFEWPGSRHYVHSLTLRFFDLADGREAYKVSATKRDRHADARRDIDELVASALARLPFAGADHRNDGRDVSDWKVTLRQAGAHNATATGPRVTEIAPLEHGSAN
jgi:hypothetical protein